jgi:gas vesicle protein
MGSAKSFVKGLAAGAVLAAVAKLVMEMKSDDKKTKTLKKTAHQVMDKVVTHAKKLSKLSKSAYEQIVDTTVAEYRGVKALTEDDLKELKKELKTHWSQVKEAMKK